MKTYYSKKITSPMTVIDERWKSVPSATLCEVWDDYYPSPFKTDFQLVHSDGGITVKMTTSEWPIHIEIVSRNKEVCEDSCMEFFLSPCACDKRYFNFEITAIGISMVGIGEGRSDRKKLNIANTGIEIQTLIHPEEGWELMYFIPKSFILKHFPSWDETMKANFYKIANSSAIRHYSAWNKLELELPDFHRSEFFGEIILTNEEI